MGEKSGFTLLELMTVIAIIAISSAFTIPNLIGWLPNYRLGSATRELLSTVQLARLSAIRDNTVVAVNVDVANDQYTAFIDNNPQNLVQDAGERTVANGKLPAGVDIYSTTLTGGTHVTGYSPRGMLLNAGASGDILITNARNRYRGVRITPTGNARIIISSDEGSTWE